MTGGAANPADLSFLGETVKDPEQFVQNMAKVMDYSSRIAQVLSEKAKEMGAAPEGAIEGAEDTSSEFGRIADTLTKVAQDYAQHPDKMIEQQQKLWQGHAAIWQNAWQKFLGQPDVEPVVAPKPGDRRFKSEDWSSNQAFDFLKQSYLFTAKWAEQAVEEAEGIDDHTRHKAKFYVEQIANAVSPSNFAFTNPEVLKLKDRCERCADTG